MMLKRIRFPAGSAQVLIAKSSTDLHADTAHNPRVLSLTNMHFLRVLRIKLQAEIVRDVEGPRFTIENEQVS